MSGQQGGGYSGQTPANQQHHQQMMYSQQQQQQQQQQQHMIMRQMGQQQAGTTSLQLGMHQRHPSQISYQQSSSSMAQQQPQMQSMHYQHSHQQDVTQQQQLQQQVSQHQQHAGQGQMSVLGQPAPQTNPTLVNVAQQLHQLQQPRSPMTGIPSVGPQLTPGGAPGSQAHVGGPTSVGPMSVQPPTPHNPASQQAIGQPSSVQASGPGSVAPATPAGNQNQPQQTPHSDPGPPLIQDPVALTKQLIMKDLRFSILDVNRRAGEALRDRRHGKEPAGSDEYMKSMNNFMAVCDEIEGNLILVCETQKQVGKLEKIFDKTLDGSKVPVSDSAAHLAAVNSYIEQTKSTQRAFDRAISHVTNTVERIRRRQQSDGKIKKEERTRVDI